MNNDTTPYYMNCRVNDRIWVRVHKLLHVFVYDVNYEIKDNLIKIDNLGLIHKNILLDEILNFYI